MLLDIRWYSGETACASALMPLFDKHHNRAGTFMFKTFMFKILLSSSEFRFKI